MRKALLVACAGVLAGAAAVSAFAAPATSSSPARPTTAAAELPRLLGFADQRLVGVDPATLHPTGRKIPIGSGGCAPRSGGTACWTYPPWTVSPDGKTLAVARNDFTSLLLVDPQRLRVLERLPLTGEVGALAWLTRTRLLAVEEAAGERQRLVVLNVATGRVVSRRPLGGWVVGLERTPQELVLLLAPAQKIGTARLAVVDRRGVLRFVRLDRVGAGSKLLGTGSQHRVDSRQPGFAVDPGGRRAFVVDQTVVAEIDLRTLKVAYHSLNRPRSLLGRLLDWLEPVASAKQVSGYQRRASWLGAGVLAVTGNDLVQSRSEPVGLFFVDTSEWTVRKIDSKTTWFVQIEELLLTMGSTQGIVAYGFDGGERFRVFEGKNAWPAQAYGGSVYVSVGGLAHPQIVDLSSGQVVGVRTEPLPWLLQGVASGWWE